MGNRRLTSEHRRKVSPAEAASRRVLRFLESETAKYGYSPTLREISEALEIPLATVRYYLVRLQGEGIIDWEPKMARTIAVLRKGA